MNRFYSALSRCFTRNDKLLMQVWPSPALWVQTKANSFSGIVLFMHADFFKKKTTNVPWKQWGLILLHIICCISYKKKIILWEEWYLLTVSLTSMSQNQLDVTCDRHLLQHSPDSSEIEISTILSNNEPITDPTDNCDVALSIILCAEGILSFLFSENIVCLLASRVFLKMKRNVIKESLQSVFPAQRKQKRGSKSLYLCCYQLR